MRYLCALYLLALLDGALCGFRAWAGRNARIEKFNYYARAMIFGAIGAQIASIIALVALVAAIQLTSDDSALLLDLQHGARAMLWIYIPFAALILFFLALRGIPSVDIRSTTSVLVLGPLTGARPLVMGLGILNAISHMATDAGKILAGVVLILMFATEIVLNRTADRRSRLT